MPRFVGQDPFKNSGAEATQRSMEMIRARRSGQYPAIDPNSTASAKANQRRQAGRERAMNNIQQIRDRGNV